MLKYVNNNQDRSNNKSARFSGTRKVHMITGDGEIQGTVDLDTAMERLEDVISCEFVGTIDVFVDENTSSIPKGNLDMHTVHKPKRHQAFTRVSMYPTDTSGRTTGKPIEMKCKLDTGASVNVMPLAAYKLINPSEFDKDNKPIGGFGQDRTTLRGHTTGKKEPLHFACINYSTVVVFIYGIGFSSILPNTGRPISIL